MSALTQAEFDSGLTYDAYRATVKQNAETLDAIFADPRVSGEQLAFLRELAPLRLAIIGEDWCPDVFNVLPRWAWIANAVPGFELRVFPRDSRDDVMAKYLTDGKKRIPVFAFFDANMREVARWSGRSKIAQAWWDGMLKGRKYPDDIPETERKVLGGEFRRMYVEQFRDANFAEVLDLLASTRGVAPPAATRP
jgi:hypothetical protein